MNDRKAKQKRKKNHHLVAQTYLKAWANGGERVNMTDTRNGRTEVRNLVTATVRRNFYTIELPDGTKSAAIENAIGRVETATASALHRTVSGAWPPSDDDRAMVANLVALHLGRAPNLRRTITDGVGDVIAKADAMTAEMRRLQQDDPAEYERRAKSFGSATIDSAGGVPIDDLRDLHKTIAHSSFAVSASLVDPIAQMRWTLLEAGDGEFVTSDQPVVLWRHPDTPDFYGTGIANAARITYPISPRFCLELMHVDRDDPSTERVRRIDAAQVDEINGATAAHADTHVVWRIPN